jgi:hypothetical protein
MYLRQQVRATILVSAVILATCAKADQVYVATNNGSFLDYNTATGSYTLIGTSSAVLWGMGYTAGGVLYANDKGSSPNVGFYKVNPNNARITLIGDISGPTSGAGTLTSPTAGGTLYYTDKSDNLFTVNPTTAVATLVGATGYTVGGTFDSDFGPDGKLYAVSDNSLYQINTTTGAATLIGSNSQDADMQGLISADGNLYGFSGDSMYSINLTNGQATFVRSTPASLGYFDDGIAIMASTPSGAPEPTSAALLLVGLGTSTYLIRRRKNLSSN